MANNRYLLFAGEEYHPLGGALDLLAPYDDLSKAVCDMHTILMSGHSSEDWWHVFDVIENKIVAESQEICLADYQGAPLPGRQDRAFMGRDRQQFCPKCAGEIEMPLGYSACRHCGLHFSSKSRCALVWHDDEQPLDLPNGYR